jgi:hypothetical protein
MLDGQVIRLRLGHIGHTRRGNSIHIAIRIMQLLVEIHNCGLCGKRLIYFIRQRKSVRRAVIAHGDATRYTRNHLCVGTGKCRHLKCLQGAIRVIKRLRCWILSGNIVEILITPAPQRPRLICTCFNADITCVAGMERTSMSTIPVTCPLNHTTHPMPAIHD